MSTAKLPILNRNEFDLWKMRIEQYFLMTNYSLWEVILNGDSLAPIRVTEGVVQPVAPTTAQQRLARKNELKARRTLLLDLPDKHQLKFNIHKDAQTLMEAIEKRFGGNKETMKVYKTLLKQQYEKFTGSCFESLDQIHDRLHKLINLEEQSLDDLFNSLKIYEAEVKSSSSTSTSTQNIAFMSSQTTNNTNDPISAVASVSATSAKILVSALPNVDTLNAEDLEEMDLKWKMAMLTVRARRFLQRTGRNLRVNGPTFMGIDMSKVECYNCHRNGHFARECRSPKDTRRNAAAEPQRQKKNQPPTIPSWHSPFQVLLVLTMRQKFEKAKQERDDLKLKLEKFQTSSKNLSQLLASQTNDKIRLGYKTYVFTSSLFDCDEIFTSETDDSLPPSPIYDRYQSGDGHHVVPPPNTGTFMPPIPDVVFHDAPNGNETVHIAFNVELSCNTPKWVVAE
nr:hypothetical protein [Tanacetum cinerariifolium]